MNALIVSIDFMKTNLQSFNRNLKIFLQQKFVAIQHQINSFISFEYNIIHSKYNKNYITFSSNHKKHLQMTINFKTSNIDFFALNLIITFEYFENDVININKYIIYRDVILFVQQIKRIVRISFENIVSRFHECFRNFAMQ